MRICPECGHADPSWWRPRNSRVFCDFTKSETLEYNNPELFKKIKEAHPTFYFDGHYLYHITRTGLNVERIEKEYHDFMGWGREGNPEKVDHSPLGLTPKLAEYMTNSDKEGES